MRVLYLVNMDPSNKTGLFNATHQRIKMNSKNVKSEVYSIRFYDGIVLKVLKKFLHLKIYKKDINSFYYDGIEYKFLYVKTTIIGKLFERIGLDCLGFIPIIYSYRKKIKMFDIISAHWGHTPGSIAYYIKKFLKIPYILTLHGSDIHTLPYTNEILKKIILRNLSYSNKCIFVSHFLKREASKLGYKNNNSLVLYNGINKEKFKPIKIERKEEIRKDLDLKPNVIGYVGNLVDVKRVDILPEIYDHLVSIFSDNFSFLIVGDGDLKGHLKKEFLKRKAENVLFTGKVSPIKVLDYLSVMDVCILPSRKEGMGMVLLEAQASGIPVIGTNVGGIPEVIIDKELILDENDLELNIARKVISIWHNKYCIRLPDKILENFSWEYSSQHEFKVFSEIQRKKYEV